jgi:hypothetical protein
MASITVSAPASGASWDSGQSHTIIWSKSPNYGTWGTFTVDLYKGSSYVENLAFNLNEFTTTLSWTIASGFTAGSDYSIQVSSSWAEGD